MMYYICICIYMYIYIYVFGRQQVDLDGGSISPLVKDTPTGQVPPRVPARARARAPARPHARPPRRAPVMVSMCVCIYIYIYIYITTCLFASEVFVESPSSDPPLGDGDSIRKEKTEIWIDTAKNINKTREGQQNCTRIYIYIYIYIEIDR